MLRRPEDEYLQGPLSSWASSPPLLSQMPGEQHRPEIATRMPKMAAGTGGAASMPGRTARRTPTRRPAASRQQPDDHVHTRGGEEEETEPEDLTPSMSRSGTVGRKHRQHRNDRDQQVYKSSSGRAFAPRPICCQRPSRNHMGVDGGKPAKDARCDLADRAVHHCGEVVPDQEQPDGRRYAFSIAPSPDRSWAGPARMKKKERHPDSHYRPVYLLVEADYGDSHQYRQIVMT